MAAGVALSTSTVNTLVLTLMSGTQLAWVCLASCGIDVSIILFFSSIASDVP